MNQIPPETIDQILSDAQSIWKQEGFGLHRGELLRVTKSGRKRCCLIGALTIKHLGEEAITKLDERERAQPYRAMLFARTILRDKYGIENPEMMVLDSVGDPEHLDEALICAFDILSWCEFVTWAKGLAK